MLLFGSLFLRVFLILTLELPENLIKTVEVTDINLCSIVVVKVMKN